MPASSLKRPYLFNLLEPEDQALLDEPRDQILEKAKDCLRLFNIDVSSALYSRVLADIQSAESPAAMLIGITSLLSSGFIGTPDETLVRYMDDCYALFEDEAPDQGLESRIENYPSQVDFLALCRSSTDPVAFACIADTLRNFTTMTTQSLILLTPEGLNIVFASEAFAKKFLRPAIVSNSCAELTQETVEHFENIFSIVEQARGNIAAGRATLADYYAGNNAATAATLPGHAPIAAQQYPSLLMKLHLRNVSSGDFGVIELDQNASVKDLRLSLGRHFTTAQPDFSGIPFQHIWFKIIGKLTLRTNDGQICCIYVDDPDHISIVNLFHSQNPDCRTAIPLEDLTVYYTMLDNYPHRPTRHNPEGALLKILHANNRRDGFFRTVPGRAIGSNFTDRLEQSAFQGDIPVQFLDPITGKLMDQPTILSNGRTYNMSTIMNQRSYQRSYPDTDPREPLLIVGANLLLTSQIDDFVSHQESQYLQQSYCRT